MRMLHRTATLALALALALSALVWVQAAPPTPPASAVDTSKGEPGFCKDDTGVTVVIDFQSLGGEAIVRCNPRSTRGTGLDALQGSGIQVEGVQRWGLAFVCRVENRPSAVEDLPITGNDGYRERCIDTPPASGYWSYWHAGNNCAWNYSQWGVKNRDFVPGGFEGWSFSLNATSDSNPKPRVAAVRPGTEGERCMEPEEAAPSTDDPMEQQPGSTADTGSQPDDDDEVDAVDDRPQDAAPGSSADDGDLPAPRRRDVPGTADDPTDNVAFDGGQDRADVREAVKDQANASDLAPWVATGVMLALATLAMLVARRRRRVRDGG